MRIFGLTAALLMVGPTATLAQIVRTESGNVRGTTADGVMAFKGIPFAAPPVGNLRWRAPQPAKPWKGVRDATKFGHDCAQKPFDGDAAPLGTPPAEDCLTVNVWKPSNAGTTKLPVMLWIYGGGYVNGGSSPDVYSGVPLAKQGLMAVSFNYRLGRFGFFAHPALSAEQPGKAGNYGLMDQLAALNWVKRNIARFGGDPAAVTIIGESAGGGSVFSLLNNPAAKGLFARAVVMSGGGRGLSAPRHLSKDQPALPSGENVGVSFAEKMGIKGSSADALKALRALPAEKVIDGFNLASLFSGGGANAPTGPVIDGVTVFSTEGDALAQGKQARVPVMIGATSADIGFLPARTKDDIFAIFGDKSSRARELYDADGSLSFQALLFKVGGDRTMVEPARYAAGKIATTGQPAWHYRFGYVAESMRNQWAGAPHATDIPYFFNTVAAKYGDKLTSADAEAARQMSGYLANFVKTGNPNGGELPSWNKFDASAAVLDFRANGGPISGGDPWKERLDMIEALVGH